MLRELNERTWAALPKLGDGHDNGPPWALLDSFVNRFSAPDTSELYLIPDWANIWPGKPQLGRFTRVHLGCGIMFVNPQS